MQLQKVTFEVAYLTWKIGFPQSDVSDINDEDGNFYFMDNDGNRVTDKVLLDDPPPTPDYIDSLIKILNPTQESVRKHLRDSYNIDINIPSHQYPDGTKEYYLEIRDWNNAPEDSDLRIFDIFNSYEEALEVALKRALEYVLANNK